MRIVVTKYVLMICIAWCCLCSCRSYKDQIVYFQNIDDIEALSSDTIYSSPLIKKGDALIINVLGDDPNVVAPFNMPAYSYLAPGNDNVYSSTMLQCYTVDTEGYVLFPVIGRVLLAGKTKKEAQNYLQREIGEIVNNPIVNIQYENYKVSILGEVAKPGVHRFKNERVTLLDLIAEAGDITLYGQRNNVLLIRDNDGKREFHRLDLTDGEVFKSSAYYLQQNDIVYIEPNESKKKNAKYSQTDQFNISLVSTIVSMVTMLTTLGITLFIK